MSKNKSGTFIHGIAASEHLDSSGERIKIEGVDISSLTKDGVFNFEHQSKEASSIVGKILEAKKILKRSDCDNDHQRHFWDRIKMPFIYVAGELFDAEGHQAANDVAAMLKYDAKVDRRKHKKLINFSIEGSRLEKDGANILKCIARKVSVTITPCNKVCEAEELKKEEVKKDLLGDVLNKNESFCEVMKNKKYYTGLYHKKPKTSAKQSYIPQPKGSAATTTGQGVKENKPGSTIEPKRTFKPDEAPKDMRVGDRIEHKKPRARTGAEIYNDPDTWKSDEKSSKVAKKSENKDKKGTSGVEKSLKSQLSAKKDVFKSNVAKALTAGSGLGAPAQKEGGQAANKENIEIKVQKVYKSISEDNWNTFQKKEELVKFLEEKLPNLSKKEVMAIAKTVAYSIEKKKELKLKELISE